MNANFVVSMWRYKVLDPNLFDTSPKWEQESNSPQDHGSRSNTNDEGVDTLDGPQLTKST